jgi:hypothetical protein
MHSSERSTGAATIACRLLAITSLIATACSPMPAATQRASAPPECSGADAVASAPDAKTLTDLRRATEMGPFYAVGSRAGVASCRITRDADSIRLEYTFRDGASLRVTRNPKIEYTDQELRLAFALVENPTAVLTRAEQAAFDAKGCGIDWKQPETAPADDDPRSTESVYRGQVCNCQARARSDASGRVMRLQLRSAC